MKVLFSSAVLTLSIALLNLSWAGQDQDKKQDKKDQKEKVLDVGKGLEINSELDSSKDKPYEGGDQEKAAHKVFLVNFVKDKTYQIDMVKDGMNDPYLFLEDSKKKVLAKDDDSGGMLNARIRFTASESGVYRIICTSFGDSDDGGFILKVAERVRIKQDIKDQTKGKALDVGKGLEIKSSLDNSKDQPYDADDAKGGNQKKNACKLFLVNLVKGKTYQIDMVKADDGGVGDPYLFVEDSKQKVLDQDDDSGGDLNSQILFTAPETGVYRIICTSFGGNDEGDFTLKIAEK